MGKKYIIELEDVSFNRHGNYADDGTELYRVKGFNALVFDRAGLDKLTPYTDPDTEVISEVAYEKGFAAGRDAAKETYSDGYKAGRQDEKYVSAESRNEAYQRGLNDAWEAARKIYLPEDHGGLGYKTRRKVFDTDNIGWIFKNLSASEAIEKIRQYEQKKEEQKEEKPILVEDVMRQYLDIFCNSHRCLDKCPLHTPEFTCGRGKHFLSLPHERVSDEEVRRAYAKVMKENE